MKVKFLEFYKSYLLFLARVINILVDSVVANLQKLAHVTVLAALFTLLIATPVIIPGKVGVVATALEFVFITVPGLAYIIGISEEKEVRKDDKL